MPLLADWLHTLDPFALRITGSLGVRWYGLSYAAGFAAAWMILKALAQRGLIRVPAQAVGDLIVWIIVGTLAGGRLGYALFYSPSLLWDFRAAAPWWGLLAINEGGMASHGGMIGVSLACVLFARRHRLPALHATDCLALVAPVGIFFGRLANFVNGELLGRAVAGPGEPAPWWAVRYPQELFEERLAPPLTPDQQSKLIDLVEEVAGPGRLDAAGLEAVIDASRRDAGVAARLAELVSARHPSQLYQAAAEGIAVGLAVWLIWARPRRPGVLTAAFLIAYGAGRVLTEFIRLPDAHLTVARFAGLSRGQWLSLLMIVAGGAVWRTAARSAHEPIGGWAAPRAAG